MKANGHGEIDGPVCRPLSQTTTEDVQVILKIVFNEIMMFGQSESTSLQKAKGQAQIQIVEDELTKVERSYRLLDYSTYLGNM